MSKKLVPHILGNVCEANGPQVSDRNSQEFRLYQSLVEPGEKFPSSDCLSAKLLDAGILEDDPRARSIHERLKKLKEQQHFGFDDFAQLCVLNPTLLHRVIEDSMVIPDHGCFATSIQNVFNEVGQVSAGNVASYIPELARVPASRFGLSLCTIDGQRSHFGDAKESFSIQSISKAISYCLASEEAGTDAVHLKIGREPSGHSFNAIALDAHHRPHNPLINSGAIVSCSLIQPKRSPADRFSYVFDTWKRLCAGGSVSFNNTVFLSERQSADRNFALAYFLRENSAFPTGTDIPETLDFYFQCCSVEMTCDSMAIAAATLANSGVNPLTGERIFSAVTVKNCLSLMYSCGMYDFSGEFAFTIGLPAKSGVGGGIMLVIPEVLGICIWSPALDENGNSVKGIEFSKKLVEMYNFHNFDNINIGYSGKNDPTKRQKSVTNGSIVDLCWAASQGDIKEIQRLYASGVNLNDGDYDGRTALHLAASEAQPAAIKFLLANGANPEAKDRWGNTPIDDAKRQGSAEIANVMNIVTKTQ